MTISRTVRDHIRSNVYGLLAVFIALGGTAWAASKIGPNDIAKNAVRAKHIKNSQVTAPKLACKGNSKQDVMVRAGAVCIDKYENSIWTKKTGGSRITGTIPCNENGQDCKGKIFARSARGVPPRVNITWFQAQAALANSGKRLPSSAEWQQAALGTPDSTACNVSSGALKNTGAEAGCVSAFGANDMVGNLWEWVADWEQGSTCSGAWPGGYGMDAQAICGAADGGAPRVLLRGGSFNEGTFAGPFAVNVGHPPSSLGDAVVGFRGAH